MCQERAVAPLALQAVVPRLGAARLEAAASPGAVLPRAGFRTAAAAAARDLATTRREVVRAVERAGRGSEVRRAGETAERPQPGTILMSFIASSRTTDSMGLARAPRPPLTGRATSLPIDNIAFWAGFLVFVSRAAEMSAARPTPKGGRTVQWHGGCHLWFECSRRVCR